MSTKKDVQSEEAGALEPSGLRKKDKESEIGAEATALSPGFQGQPVELNQTAVEVQEANIDSQPVPASTLALHT